MMSGLEAESADLTYPLRGVIRLTGLSAELLRAWERRYGAVTPARTAGGSRRYSAAEIERLKLLKEAVDAGDRIGQIATLSDGELKARLRSPRVAAQGPLDEVLAALGQLDDEACRRILAFQLSTLGPARFSREFALPLLQEIGQRWSEGTLSIASEHLATGILQSLLGSALHSRSSSLRGPRVVFATPPGEKHSLGLLMSTVTALAAGANPLYLGPELPVDELLSAVRDSGASALALGLATIDEKKALDAILELRAGLPDDVYLWIGGFAAAKVPPVPNVDYFPTLESFERRLILFDLERRGDV